MMRGVVLLFLIYGATCLPVEDEALKEFIVGNHKFTSGVYKEFLRIERGSFVFSPFSVETVLALTNEGARGATSEELVTGLSLPRSKENIQRVFKSFLPTLKTSDEDLKLLSANKIYVGKDVKLQDDFRKIATTIYESGVENVDFEKKEAAVDTINAWVEDNTNNKIQDLLSTMDIDDHTKMILVNALYFDGKWESEFKTNYTKKAPFYKSARDSENVDTMYQFASLNYYENRTLNAKFLELPYKGSGISMVIVLPNEIEGLAKLEENIQELLTPQPFNRVFVRVNLPRFTVHTGIELTPVLKTLGIKKLFKDTDLTGLSSTHKNLSVDKVIQKAFINVTETGTEAAAATAVIVAVPESIQEPPPVYEFTANHPFFYVIKNNDVVLFAGRITYPLSE